MAILRQPGAWKGPGGLAAAPLLLATIMPLIARIVPQFLVPSLFRFSYTTDELALLVILLAGAAVVASRSFPTWSYTWVVLMFTSLEAFLFSLLPTLLFNMVDWGWLFYAARLSMGILVVVFAVSRAGRGLTHTYFIVAVYVASIALRVFIQEEVTWVSPVELVVANSFTIFIAALELMVVLAALAHFLAGDARVQRKSVYVLLVVAVLDPILTGSNILLISADPASAEAVKFLGLGVIFRWVHIGAALLLTWGLITLILRIRKANISSPPPSGGAGG